MIFRRVLMALLAVSALATAASVLVFALAFALYALVEPWFGRAGAAACVALTAATFMAIGGLLAAGGARGKASKAPPVPTGGLVERAFAFLQKKPVLAVSAAIGAGILAIRNPQYLGSLVRAFVDGKPPKA